MNNEEFNSLAQQLSKPGLHFVQMMHDDDCPTITTQRETDCICKPIVKLVTEKTWVNAVVKTRQQVRKAESAAAKTLRKAWGV
jgi:hypothetical protein